MSRAKKAAQTDNSVFLIGESGTGKEVVAQSIHRDSYRGGQSFVDINCASLPETLLDSELFGYVPGALTGDMMESIVQQTIDGVEAGA